MRDLTELNITEDGAPVTRPAPTEADYLAFGKRWGLTFPPALEALLAYANGGHPEKDGIRSQIPPEDWPLGTPYDPDSDPENGMFVVDHFLRLQTGDKSPRGFTHWMEALSDILGPEDLPFAADPHGNIFFIDTVEEPPSVNIWLREEKGTLLLADSFETFIDALQENPYREDSDGDEESDDSTVPSASRYEGKPLLRLLECYVLLALDQLPAGDAAQLTELAGPLSKLYGHPGTWDEIIAAEMQFPDHLPALIREVWEKNQAIAAKNETTLTPGEFAEMFVDTNLA